MEEEAGGLSRIEACSLCPRRCGVKREAQAGAGFCRMGADPVLARAALHPWEEPCISGSRGSGTVFFVGCSLQCVYCQNSQISRGTFAGKRVTPQALSAVFHRLIDQGAHNINLVNPTHFASAIVQALQYRPLSVPVVYNSSGYELLSTLRMLDGLVDIYLPDLKYSSKELAETYSRAPDYVERASAAILEMVRQTGEAVFDEDGLLQRGTMVRHLILPGRTKNSIGVLQWLHDHLPEGALVSLMAQYIPHGEVSDTAFPELNRTITKREVEKVQEVLFSLNLDGFVQERTAAKEVFIPPFNLEGLPK